MRNKEIEKKENKNKNKQNLLKFGENKITYIKFIFRNGDFMGDDWLS